MPISVGSPSYVGITSAKMSGAQQVEPVIAFWGSIRGKFADYEWEQKANSGVIIGRVEFSAKGEVVPRTTLYSTGSVSVAGFVDVPNRVLAGRFNGKLTIPNGMSGSWTTTNSDYFVASVEYPSWVKILSSSAFDYGDIHIGNDSGGNVYVIGSYSSPLSYGGSSPLPLVGQSDIFIIKYSSSGTVVWAKSLSGAGNDRGLGVVVLSDDSIVIAGTTTGIFHSVVLAR